MRTNYTGEVRSRIMYDWEKSWGERRTCVLRLCQIVFSRSSTSLVPQEFSHSWCNLCCHFIWAMKPRQIDYRVQRVGYQLPWVAYHLRSDSRWAWGLDYILAKPSDLIHRKRSWVLAHVSFQFCVLLSITLNYSHEARCSLFCSTIGSSQLTEVFGTGIIQGVGRFKRMTKCFNN